MLDKELVQELVQKAQAGDVQAFEEIYDLYAQKIFRFIKLKIQNQQQAEDVLQEVFIKAWRALPKFNTQGGYFSAWLYRIATNAINDYFRQVYRTPQSVELTEEVNIFQETTLEEKVTTKQELTKVKNALKKLPAQYQQILELRFIQDFSVKETAEILNRSNLTVRVLQHRALKKLRGILKQAI